MKILIQNLQKQSGLAGELVEEHHPDLMLAQEINLSSEDPKYHFDQACFVSKRLGYGTAIGAIPQGDSTEGLLDNVCRVESPHAEAGGWITKKTTIADYHHSIHKTDQDSNCIVECISFHGYNGTPFRRYEEYLVDQVRAVLGKVRSSGQAIFAGDFNTWTPEHLARVSDEMAKHGFEHAYSWEYPNSTLTLDHVFLRELKLESATNYACKSDHRGAIVENDNRGIKYSTLTPPYNTDDT